MNANVERRQFPRADADFTLTMDTGLAGADPVPVKDISPAGVCCLLELPLPVMTEVAMRLQIPRQDGTIVEVRCEGAVVRCDPSPEAPAASEPASGDGPAPNFEVAIFFLQVDSAGRDAIEEYVHARLARRPVGQPA